MMNAVIQLLLIIIIVFTVKYFLKVKVKISFFSLVFFEGLILYIARIITETSGYSIVKFFWELIIIFYFFYSFRGGINWSLIYLLSLIIILSTAFSLHNNILNYIYGFRWLIIPILSYFVISKENNIEQVRKIIYFIIFITGILSIKQYLFPSESDFEFIKISTGSLHQYYESLRPEKFGEASLFLNGRIRSFGIFNANLNNVIITSSLINILLYIYKDDIKKVLFISLPYLLYLIFSLDRTGILYLIIPLLVYIYWKMPMKMFKFLSIILIILIYLKYILTNPYFYNLTIYDPKLRRLLESINPFSALTVRTGRFYLWLKAIDVLKNKSIITGYGLGTTINSPRIDIIIAPHNSYLQLLIEIGLVGLFLYLLLIYKMIKLINNNYQKLAFSIIFPIILNAFFNDNFYGTNAISLFFTLGIVRAISYKMKLKYR